MPPRNDTSLLWLNANGVSYNEYIRYFRGHSSVGRAFEWHSKGRGFDSPWLHQGIYTDFCTDHENIIGMLKRFKFTHHNQY